MDGTKGGKEETNIQIDTSKTMKDKRIGGGVHLQVSAVPLVLPFLFFSLCTLPSLLTPYSPLPSHPPTQPSTSSSSLLPPRPVEAAQSPTPPLSPPTGSAYPRRNSR